MRIKLEKRIEIKVSSQLKKQVESFSSKQHQTTADFIRAAIREKIEREKQILKVKNENQS